MNSSFCLQQNHDKEDYTVVKIYSSLLFVKSGYSIAMH